MSSGEIAFLVGLVANAVAILLAMKCSKSKVVLPVYRTIDSVKDDSAPPTKISDKE